MKHDFAPVPPWARSGIECHRRTASTSSFEHGGDNKGIIGRRVSETRRRTAIVDCITAVHSVLTCAPGSMSQRSTQIQIATAASLEIVCRNGTLAAISRSVLGATRGNPTQRETFERCPIDGAHGIVHPRPFLWPVGFRWLSFFWLLLQLWYCQMNLRRRQLPRSSSSRRQR
jgi:hypothetical protein